MEKKTIKAEIMADRLILDGKELRLEGLKSLFDYMEPGEFHEEIASLSLSIAQIGALISESLDEKEVNVENLKMAFPSYNCLFALMVISDSLKKM